MAKRLTSLLLSAAAFLPSPVTAQPSQETLAAAAPAIVRVVASRCPGGESRSGTGFVWRSAEKVVTAMHVVAGCSAVQVFYQGQQVNDASVSRVLKSADLALLEVRDPPRISALVASSRVPVGETVVVYGYALGVATREERRLYVTAANNEAPNLSDAINAEARDQLRAIGAPSLDTEVLRVDGNLVPGHSGAPVIDAQGRVIGIGSGGLQRGTVGIGWAVRARYLTELLSAPGTASGIAPALGPAAGASFATVSAELSGRRLRCADLDFVQTRTRLPLEVLVASSDDRLGFQQIAATTARPWDVLARLQFDIWTEARSGAGVAVPTGQPLQQKEGRCSVEWSKGDVEFLFSGMKLPRPNSPTWETQVQTVTSQFEAQWAREFIPYLMLDPRFSYGPPRTGPGGFVVNRKTFMGQRPAGSPYAIFETLLAKETASIGVAAITRRYPTPYATPDEQTFLAWVASVFAAHLSTVPP